MNEHSETLAIVFLRWNLPSGWLCASVCRSFIHIHVPLLGQTLDMSNDILYTPVSIQRGGGEGKEREREREREKSAFCLALKCNELVYDAKCNWFFLPASAQGWGSEWEVGWVTESGHTYTHITSNLSMSESLSLSLSLFHYEGSTPMVKVYASLPVTVSCRITRVLARVPCLDDCIFKYCLLFFPPFMWSHVAVVYLQEARRRRRWRWWRRRRRRRRRRCILKVQTQLSARGKMKDRANVRVNSSSSANYVWKQVKKCQAKPRVGRRNILLGVYIFWLLPSTLSSSRTRVPVQRQGGLGWKERTERTQYELRSNQCQVIDAFTLSLSLSLSLSLPF